MVGSAIALQEVMPLSSVAVLVVPVLIVLASAIVVTLGVLVSRFVSASSVAAWAWVQELPSRARRMWLTIGRLGVPCR